MGIYWYAYNEEKNTYFCSPTNLKGNCIITPDNSFPQMFIMMKMRGESYSLVNDMIWEMDDDSKDVTQEIYEEYLRSVPWAEEYYKEKDSQ